MNIQRARRCEPALQCGVQKRVQFPEADGASCAKNTAGQLDLLHQILETCDLRGRWR